MIFETIRIGSEARSEQIAFSYEFLIDKSNALHGPYLDSAPPEMANLPDIFVALKIFSS
jgi:hypothetical protein